MDTARTRSRAMAAAAALLVVVALAAGCTPPTNPPAGDALGPAPSVTPTVRPDGSLHYPALRYGAASGTQVLDLYRPAGPGPHPLVVWYHGGYWTQGSRNQLPTSFRDSLVEAGYAVATVEYRLAEIGKNQWPVQVVDAKLAVKYLQTHAGALALDDQTVFSAGHSAGGHLALMVAVARYAPGQALSHGDPVVQGALTFGAPVDVGGLMAVNPVADLAVRLLLGCGIGEWCDADPIEPWRYLDEHDPDLLMVSGAVDIITPPSEAALMASTAGDVGFAGLTTTTLAGLGHDDVNSGAPASSYLPWLLART